MAASVRTRTSRSDFLAVAALARGASFAEAAREARCSERTIRRRMTDPSFRARVSGLRDDMLSRATGLLIEASVEAVAALRAIIAKPEASDGTVVRASVAILQLGETLRDGSELASRVAALEQAVIEPGRRTRLREV